MIHAVIIKIKTYKDAYEGCYHTHKPQTWNSNKSCLTFDF